MTGLLITLACLVGIGLVPVGVHAVYEEDLTVSLMVLGIRLRLYPARKKAKEASAEKTPKGKKKRSFPPRTALEEYLRLLLELLGRLRRKILIRELKLHAVFGGSEDAAALNYGRAWAAIGTVMPLLEACFRIKKRDVGAFISGQETSLRLYAKAAATLTVAQLLHLALRALFRFLKIYKSHQPEKAVQ